MKRQLIFIAFLFISLLSMSAGQTRAAKLTEDQRILHILNRLSFGPQPGDIERVRKIGISAYIEEQLHPERIDDSKTEALLKIFPSIGMDVAAINQKYVPPNELARRLGLNPASKLQANQGSPDDSDVRKTLQVYYEEHGLNPPQRLLQELQGQKLVRAVYSDRQLAEVMTDFWYNHFNVFWGKGADKQLATDYEMNAIRPHVLGKFKDLVMATARNPAMLFYLDNAQSSSPNMKTPAMERLEQLQQRRMLAVNNPRALERIDEQIMQVQQRIAQANSSNTRKPGINENYARELMELHTMGVDGGYRQKDVQEVARAFTGWTIDHPRQDARFVFRDAMHDGGTKIVLGHKIEAGGIHDGEQVIDILVHHPSTAHFIAAKLVRRFVSDEPPAALVDRVAAVYMKSEGDIREMLRTIFLSDEFQSPSAYRAKTKSPFELAVSAIRALGGDTNGSPRLAQEIARMGQPLYQYQAPTGFPDRASEWTSSGAILERLNFGIALVHNKIPGTAVEVSRFADETRAPDSAVERAGQVLLNGDISPQTQRILIEQVRSSSEPSLMKAFAMVLGSPEFQKH